jgi:hypothetical protein
MDICSDPLRPMTWTSEKSAKADEIHRISNLYTRSLCTPSNREKNLLLLQLRHLFEEQCLTIEKAAATNSIKAAELATLERSLAEVNNELKRARIRVGLFNELRRRSGKIDSEALVKSIYEIEAELGLYAPLDRPTIIGDTFARSLKVEDQTTLLRDIKLQRLEELIHMLQRRIIFVEQNQDSAEQVLGEFGSVFSLIDLSKVLLRENQRLRSKELEYLPDSVIRRRISERITFGAGRSLVLLLQKELEIQRSVLADLQWKPGVVRSHSCQNPTVKAPRSRTRTNASPPPSKVEGPATAIDGILGNRAAFEDLCHDPQFGLSTSLQSSGPRDVLASDPPIEEAIVLIRNNVTTANEQLRKIEKDLEALRKCQIPLDSLAGHRLTRLIELNHVLMGRLRNAQEHITNRNGENEELARQLLAVILDKQKYQHTIAAICRSFRALFTDHSSLERLQCENLSIVSSLWYFCSACGLDLQAKAPIQSRSLVAYLKPILDDLVRVLQEKKKKRLEDERRFKERRSEKRKGLWNPDFRGSRSDDSGAGSQIRFEFPSNLAEVHKSLVEAKQARERFHFFTMLTTALHCWAPELGVHPIVIKTWKELAAGMAETFRAQLREVGAFQARKMAMLKDVNVSLLRRGRISAGASTTPVQLSEDEAQTEDVRPTTSKKAPITVPKVAKAHK